MKEHLFEDIVLDPAVAVRVNEKVNLSVCNGKSLKSVTSQNLASLFEYTEDPYRILAETERKSGQLKNRLKAKKKPSKPAADRRKQVPKRTAPEAEETRETVTPEKTAEVEVQPEVTPTVEVQPEATPVVEVQPEATPVVEAGETATVNQPLN